MANYRTIDYAKMIFETLRSPLSVTKVYFVAGVQYGGVLSILYRYCVCCIWPFQNWWNNFETYRIKKKYIAYCKWETGHVTNLLNFLYDNTQKRIYISFKIYTNIFVPSLYYESTVLVPAFAAGVQSLTRVPSIANDGSGRAGVIINVPNSIYIDPIVMADLVSTIEQIKLTGIDYIIQSI
jgi:hypothetical protein